MDPSLKTHLEDTVMNSIGYIQQTQNATDIKNCGVDELIVFLANEDRARLRDAAKICKEPPAIQRAACGLLKAFSNHISLNDVVLEIHRILKLTDIERQLSIPDPFLYHSSRNAYILALSVHDLNVAHSIKENGVPELIIVLANLSKTVTLAEAATICDELPEVQRAACELWLMCNRSSQKVDLKSCVQQVKEFITHG